MPTLVMRAPLSIACPAESASEAPGGARTQNSTPAGTVVFPLNVKAPCPLQTTSVLLVWIGLASGTTLLQSKVMMFSCVIKKRERRPRRATGAVVQALTEKPVCLRIGDVEKAVTSLGNGGGGLRPASEIDHCGLGRRFLDIDDRAWRVFSFGNVESDDWNHVESIGRHRGECRHRDWNTRGGHLGHAEYIVGGGFEIRIGDDLEGPGVRLTGRHGREGARFGADEGHAVLSGGVDGSRAALRHHHARRQL